MLSLATAFNLHAKVLSVIGVDVFLEPQSGNAEHRERIKDGQRLIRREREKRERNGGSTGAGSTAMDICGGRSSPYKRNTPRKNRAGSSNSKNGTPSERYTEV